MLRRTAPARNRRLPAWLAGLAVSLLPLLAAAQTSVSLQGRLGNKALLMVDDSGPRAVAPGETYQGVKVVSTGDDQAVVLVDGQRLTLRIGQTPANVGQAASNGGDRIVLLPDGHGHFSILGSINNQTVQFVADTGATLVSLGQSEADRVGLDYKHGRPTHINTANGSTMGWRFRIPTMRVGDVVSHGVEAVVTPAPMPVVLLGNSFLSHFNMQSDGDQMVLTKR